VRVVSVCVVLCNSKKEAWKVLATMYFFMLREVSLN
jgi:hypothetical protein